jgi:hypothetical protein
MVTEWFVDAIDQAEDEGWIQAGWDSPGIAAEDEAAEAPTYAPGADPLEAPFREVTPAERVVDETRPTGGARCPGLSTRSRRGRAVAGLQQALRSVGAPLEADGVFGPTTQAAVRSFQLTRLLPPDGVVDFTTWDRLCLAAGLPVPGPAVSAPGGPLPTGTAHVPTTALGSLVVNAPEWTPLSYPFTGEDLIWTAKLLEGESPGGKDGEAVLWAMFNRFALLTHGRYGTFSSFIRSYSTPLQPVLCNAESADSHQGKPSFVPSGGTYPGTNIPRGQLRRHLEIQRKPWGSIEASARQVATRALRGDLPNPGIGNASEFASTTTYYKRRHKTGDAPSPEQWRQFTTTSARRKGHRWIGDVPGLDQMRHNAFFLVEKISGLRPGAVRVLAPASREDEATGQDLVVAPLAETEAEAWENGGEADEWEGDEWEGDEWEGDEAEADRSAPWEEREVEPQRSETGGHPSEWASIRAEALGVDLRLMEEAYEQQVPAPAVDWCQVRYRIVRSAVEMQGAWLRAGNSLHGEGAARVLPFLVQFWRDGVGLSRAQAKAVAAISASDHKKHGFWSAAFISWCVRNALPDPPPPHNGGFRFSSKHMAYIAGAARNRHATDASRPFWLYDVNDPDVVPVAGDILCLNRSRTSHSFTSVHNTWVVKNPKGQPDGKSHTDIVIGHFEDRGRRWIETIGGNVSDTVGSRYYSLDGNGRLVDEVTLAGNPVPGRAAVTRTIGKRPAVVFALIRLTGCPV